MSTVVTGPNETLGSHVPILIVGAGAAGLCAALAAKEAGVDAVVIERDAVPSGSTALSAGLIPAAGTRFQRAKGIADNPATFAADIQRKAKGEADPAVVEAVAQGAGSVIEWLAERYGLPFDVVDNFNYPGHAAMRMHGLPSRTGQELIDRLRQAAEANDVVILTRSVVDRVLAGAGGHIRGVDIVHHDGTRESVGCDALILACNGYGGNPELVRRYIPEMADALYFGHPGNRGDAVIWGDALGAQLSHLSAFQGHGSVATPHNILISWAVIMQGGIQVNREGRRFCDETHGYSEQAAEVLRQPGGFAWDAFDGRIADVARQFEDFKSAERAGAILTADTIADLAKAMQIPASDFAAEWNEVEALKSAGARDRYGREFLPQQSCKSPVHAVKVTGALFHTQGGLAVDSSGRVKRKDGTTFPNLFAAGGAAVGVSGSVAAGYLSGNGLLTATVLGRLAGRAAAGLVQNQALK
jgi:fumarate reductase flavoprotein subunit